jgi:serine/threonine protein kinase
MIEERQELLRLRMSARGLEKLYETLQQLCGRTLAERFILQHIHAVGGESVLWMAKDLLNPEIPVLAREALIHWQRPAYLRDADISHARQRIVREAERLRRFAHTPLPQWIDLVHMANPLVPREFGRDGSDQEPLLIMEYIPGPTVLEWLNSISRTTLDTGGIRYAVACDVADASLGLFAALQRGDCLYTDLKPANLILSPSAGSAGVRVLDAGSITSITESTAAPIAYSQAYVPLGTLDLLSQRKPWRPDERFVLCTLGKTLHQILTGRHPIPGVDPKFERGDGGEFKPEFLEWSLSLIRGTCDKIRDAREAYQSLMEMGHAPSRDPRKLRPE